MPTLSAPTYADVADAAQRIAGAAHRTPVLTSSTANERTGASLFFKCENFQRMGAFKFRGAYNAISHFDYCQRDAGVLTYSSGNHAQAIALSARLAGIHATIIMPHDAPAAKIAATQRLRRRSDHLRPLQGESRGDRPRLAEERGMTLIPPYDHPHVIAGQGTSAKELIEETGPLDMLFVCLGGGGLLARRCAGGRGVEPGVQGDRRRAGGRQRRAAVACARRDRAYRGAAHDRGRRRIDASRRIQVSDHPAHVEQVVTVSDAQLIETMRFFAQRMKMVVEPTGCLAAAAVLNKHRAGGGQACRACW